MILLKRSRASVDEYCLASVTGVSTTKKHAKVLDFIDFMAERTGLEPATPGVTGRYSNQLNYRSVLL